MATLVDCSVKVLLSRPPDLFVLPDWPDLCLRLSIIVSMLEHGYLKPMIWQDTVHKTFHVLYNNIHYIFVTLRVSVIVPF